MQDHLDVIPRYVHFFREDFIYTNTLSVKKNFSQATYLIFFADFFFTDERIFYSMVFSPYKLTKN